MKPLCTWCLVVVAILAGDSPAQELLFAPAPDSPIAVSGAPTNVAMADLNKDSRPDLVVACGSGKAIAVLLGQGDGRFRAGRTVTLPDGPGEMALGDVNGDGALDLAAAHHDSYGVTLLLGDGKGSLALAPNSPIVMKEGQHPHTHGLAMGDLNDDKQLDLATVNNEDNDVSVALGDGRGGFKRAAGSPFAVGQSPYPLTLGDLDHDGHLDIVATSTALGPSLQDKPPPRELAVLFNNGRGGFRRGAVPLRTEKPWFVAIADLNTDQNRDLVVTHAERNELTVLLGDGRGRLTEVSSSPFDLGHAAWQIAIADVNRDRRPDVIAAAGYDVRVLLGDGQGNFKAAPGSPYPSGKGSWRLAVGDLNGDGKPDIATPNLESDTVSVLLAK
jgi:hypothetical protein